MSARAKPAHRKIESLAVKAPAPARPALILLDKGKLHVSAAVFWKIANTFLGPDKARSLDLKLKSRTSLQTTLLGQVSGAVPYANGKPLNVEALNFALDAVASLEPRDGLEALLCSQMVALHSQSMEFMRRGMLPEQSSDGVDTSVKRATRLLRTFASLTESLRAHRGGGKQTVTVEHVTVQAGGQAIVGTVNRGAGGGDAQQNGE